MTTIFVVLSYEDVTGLCGVHKGFVDKEKAEAFKAKLEAYKKAEPEFPHHLFDPVEGQPAPSGEVILTMPEYLAWDEANTAWQKQCPVPVWPGSADGFVINTLEVED